TAIAASVMALGLTAPAHAATVDSTCGITTTKAAASAYKATHPLDLAGNPTAAERKAAAAHDAEKTAWLGAKPVSCNTSGFTTQASGQITWMYHYTQATNY